MRFASSSERPTLASACVVLAACSTFGCGDAVKESGSGNDPAIAETADGIIQVRGTIDGRLLHTLEKIPGHVLQFYDFGDGEVGVRESLEIGDTAVLDAIKAPVAMGEVFRVARPGVEVPVAILEADKRAAHIKATRTNIAKDVGAAVGQPELDSEPGATGAVHEAYDVTGAIAASCSPDYNNDGWAADWFISNHCNEGCLRNCYKNYLSGGWETDYDWFRWKQLEGDFNISGYTRGWRTGFPYAGRKTIWSYDVLPRRVEIWTMTGGTMTKHAEGSSPCGHMSWAALRCN
jgi:hypothetical protein